MFTLFAAFLALCEGGTTGRVPHLLVLKSVDQYEVVANKNLTISLNVFNVGGGTAYNVNVDDTAWAADSVTDIEGLKTATFESLEPGTNETHTYVVAAKMPGELPSAAAKVTYQSDASSEDGKMVYSNILPRLPVLTLSDYNKKNTRHIKEWLTFFVLALIPVGLPACMYILASQKLAILSGDEPSPSGGGSGGGRGTSPTRKK